MEKAKIKKTRPIIETIQTGTEEYEIDGFIASDGKTFTLYHDCKRHEANLGVKNIFSVDIEYNEEEYNWYYCQTKDDLNAIAFYCEYKQNSLDYINLPQWIGVAFHDDDYNAYYSILLKDDIDKNYKEFIDRIKESEIYYLNGK